MSFNQWQSLKVGDVADVLNGYAFKSKDFTNEGIPVIKIKNIVPPSIELSDVQYVSEELFNEKERFALKYNDILISMTGSNVNQIASAVGKIGRIRLKNKKLLLNQRVGKLYVTDSDKCNEDFLYYYLIQDEVRYNLASSASGSANQANINPNQIKNISINLPPIDEQKAIAKILSDLDKKIETNNKINKKLEEIAQAIFKQWFVDFEFPNEDGKPYKSSGGEMVESELGMIPKGWNSKSLLDIADYLNGLAMQKFRPEDDEKGIPVLKIKELRQGKSDENSDLCSLNIDPKYIIHDGDVIFSWSGSLLVDFWCGGKCGLNQHLFKVTSSKFEKWFYYLWTKYHLDKFTRIAKDKATTMGHIKRADLSNSIVLVPNEVIMNKANLILNPIVEKIIEARIEERKLSQLRDTLLPKLMSGEIRVPID